MDEVIAVTHAERGLAMLHEADGGLVFRVARGMDRSTIDDPQFQVSRSVVELVAQEGQSILTSNARADARFRQRESVMMLGLRTILYVPLSATIRATRYWSWNWLCPMPSRSRRYP